jgi:hypothetical protein
MSLEGSYNPLAVGAMQAQAGGPGTIAGGGAFGGLLRDTPGFMNGIQGGLSKNIVEGGIFSLTSGGKKAPGLMSQLGLTPLAVMESLKQIAKTDPVIQQGIQAVAQQMSGGVQNVSSAQLMGLSPNAPQAGGGEIVIGWFPPLLFRHAFHATLWLWITQTLHSMHIALAKSPVRETGFSGHTALIKKYLPEGIDHETHDTHSNTANLPIYWSDNRGSGAYGLRLTHRVAFFHQLCRDSLGWNRREYRCGGTRPQKCQPHFYEIIRTA